MPGKRRIQVEQVIGKKKKKKTDEKSAQMKERGKNSWDQINEEELSNLPERVFRYIKYVPRLEDRMEKMQGTFNTVNTITKDIEEIKNKQTEMNNTIT